MPTSLNVSITTNGTDEVGQMYSLTCTPTVSGRENVTRISWLKDSGMIRTTTTATTLNYTIASLSIGDYGKYTCRVQVQNLIKIRTQILDVPTG